MRDQSKSPLKSVNKKTSRWSWLPGLEIRVAEWEDEVVVFNKLTQDTHLFKKPVDWILNSLKNQSYLFDALVKLAIQNNIMDDDEENRKVFSDLLNHLEKLDLIESRLNDDEGISPA